MIAITMELVGIPGVVRELEQAVDAGARDALYDAAKDVAAYARAHHNYQNRTGQLEKNTKARRPTGRFMAGTLEAEVVADTDYAQYVNAKRKFRFLEPAADAMSAAVQRRFGDALGSAVQRKLK